MRLRHLAGMLTASLLAVFVLAIFAVERIARTDIAVRMENYARFIAAPYADHQDDICRDYLSLIMELESHRWFRLIDAQGNVTLTVKSPVEEVFLDRMLRRIGLVHDLPLQMPLRTNGQVVGTMETLWTDRNAYFYIGLAPFLATIGLIVFASAWFRKNRERHQEDLLRLEREKVKRLESQRDLEEAQKRYKQLVDSATDIIYECDLKGRFKYINPTADNLLGFGRAALIGKHFSGLVPPEYRKELMQRFLTQAQNREPTAYMEFPVIDKDGKERWLGQHVQLVFEDGEPAGYQAVARDITDLKNALAELAERDAHMQEEMRVARAIHQSMIPLSVPKLAGFEFGLKLVPSGMLGGDFINFIEYPDRTRLGVIFADITGHGVAAALLSAMFKVLVDEVMHSGASPSSCFNMLNRRLAAEYPEGNYVSAFFAIFDRRNRTMTYVKASQEPVYILRPNEPARCLEAGGPALGLLDPFTFGEPGYDQVTIQLQAGDTVFFYTDGLVELWNASREMLDPTAIQKWLEESRHLGPQELVDEMHRRAIAFAGTTDLDDDVAELAVRVEPT